MNSAHTFSHYFSNFHTVMRGIEQTWLKIIVYSYSTNLQEFMTKLLLHLLDIIQTNRKINWEIRKPCPFLRSEVCKDIVTSFFASPFLLLTIFSPTVDYPDIHTSPAVPRVSRRQGCVTAESLKLFPFPLCAIL